MLMKHAFRNICICNRALLINCDPKCFLINIKTNIEVVYRYFAFILQTWGCLYFSNEQHAILFAEVFRNIKYHLKRICLITLRLAFV